MEVEVHFIHSFKINGLPKHVSRQDYIAGIKRKVEEGELGFNYPGKVSVKIK